MNYLIEFSTKHYAKNYTLFLLPFSRPLIPPFSHANRRAVSKEIGKRTLLHLHQHLRVLASSGTPSPLASSQQHRHASTSLCSRHNLHSFEAIATVAVSSKRQTNKLTSSLNVCGWKSNKVMSLAAFDIV